MIGNQCCIPSLLKRELEKKDHKVSILTRRGIEDHGVRWSIPGRVWRFKLNVLWYANGFDIVHVHDYDDVLAWLKRVYPKKPLLLTYHGTQIRDLWKERKKFHQYCDKITVVSKDLYDNSSEDDVSLVLNAPDSQLFQRINEFIPNTAFYSHIEINRPELRIEMKELASEKQLCLRIQDRKIWKIPYLSFPRFLELFEFVFDYKTSNKGMPIPALSLLALQQLSLGGNVIHWGKKISTLPKEHTLEKMINNYLKIYEELLE